MIESNVGADKCDQMTQETCKADVRTSVASFDVAHQAAIVSLASYGLEGGWVSSLPQQPTSFTCPNKYYDGQITTVAHEGRGHFFYHDAQDKCEDEHISFSRECSASLSRSGCDSEHWKAFLGSREDTFDIAPKWCQRETQAEEEMPHILKKACIR